MINGNVAAQMASPIFSQNPMKKAIPVGNHVERQKDFSAVLSQKKASYALAEAPEKNERGEWAKKTSASQKEGIKEELKTKEAENQGKNPVIEKEDLEKKTAVLVQKEKPKTGDISKEENLEEDLKPETSDKEGMMLFYFPQITEIEAQISAMKDMLSEESGPISELVQKIETQMSSLKEILKVFPEMAQEMKDALQIPIDKLSLVAERLISTMQANKLLSNNILVQDARIISKPLLGEQKGFDVTILSESHAIQEIEVLLSDVKEDIQNLKAHMMRMHEAKYAKSGDVAISESISETKDAATTQLQQGNEEPKEGAQNIQGKEVVETGQEGKEEGAKEGIGPKEEVSPFETKLQTAGKVLEPEMKETASDRDKMSSSILKQVREQAHLKLNGGKQEIRIALKPENLGEMTLKVQIYKGQLMAKALVQNETVRGALENQLQELKHIFQAQGYKQVTFSVEAQKQNLHDANQSFEEKRREQVLYFSKKIQRERILGQLEREWQGGYVPKLVNYIGEKGMDVKI